MSSILMGNKFYGTFFCFLAICLLTCSTVQAQYDKTKNIKPGLAIKIADVQYEDGHYFNAIDYYQEAHLADKERTYPLFMLGVSNLMARDYSKAVVWFKKYEKAIKSDSKKSGEKKVQVSEQYFRYYYGIALKHNEQYDEAEYQFNRFLSEYKGLEEDNWKAKTKNELEGCALAKTMSAKKIRINTLGESINNAYGESSPLPAGDSILYFSSLRANKIMHADDYQKSHALLYMSKKQDGNWVKAKALPSIFNDPNFTNGNGAFSEDGERFYFTRCTQPANDEVVCQIFLSENVNGRWTEPIKLPDPINKPVYTSTHPAVRDYGNGNELVYFSSDRPGGKGGMDLWYFIRTPKGDFKGPKNVENNINTIGDEMTPYFNSVNNSLYFSSNGHPSIGGFDIFVSAQMEDLEYKAPKNLGLPINSSADDLFYIREENAKSGYLVSNRVGTTPLLSETCCDDIFHFENFRFGVEGFVFQGGTDKTRQLDGATFQLFAKDDDGSEYLQASTKTDGSEEKYFLKLDPDTDYRLVISRPGFEDEESILTTKGLNQEDTLNVDFEIAPTAYPLKGSIFFTDGEGDKHPLGGTILTVDEVDDDGEKINSISTDKVEDTDYKTSLPANKLLKVQLAKDGYFSKSFIIDTRKVHGTQIVRDIELMEMQKDRAYSLSNIYYEFNSATLSPASQLVLDTLVVLLSDNPDIIIELSSHTDSKGGDAFNKKLSQQRAESCVNYLTYQGIPNSRLKAVGYGEAFPIAPNVNPDGTDNEAGRAKNRRTVFKITGTLKGSKVIFKE